MNSAPNSDSEQCTKSKLSRVHSAPTLGPACVHTAPRPCHRPGPIVSRVYEAITLCARTSWHVLSCAVSRPSVMIQILYRDTSPLPRVMSSRRASCHGTSCAVSQPCCVVSQPKGRPTQSQYKILYRDLRQPGHVHTPHAQAGRVLAYIVALPCRVVGTIQSIVS